MGRSALLKRLNPTQIIELLKANTRSKFIYKTVNTYTMENHLLRYTCRKSPLILRVMALLTIQFMLSVQLLAQEPPHFSMVANMPATAQHSNMGMGAAIWIVITLLFSFTLNYIIRRGEKQPEKAVVTEPTAQIEQKNAALTTETADIAVNTRKNSKPHPQYTQILQPNLAMHLIKSSRHKIRVAS